MLLDQFSVVLSSDPSVATFYGHNCTTTPDFIFCSRILLPDCSVKVHSNIDSPHLPLCLEVQSFRSVKNSVNNRTVLHTDSCFQFLNSSLSTLNDSEAHDIIHLLDFAFEKHLGEVKPRSKRWISRNLRDLKAKTVDALRHFRNKKTELARDHFLAVEYLKKRFVRLRNHSPIWKLRVL